MPTRSTPHGGRRGRRRVRSGGPPAALHPLPQGGDGGPGDRPGRGAVGGEIALAKVFETLEIVRARCTLSTATTPIRPPDCPARDRPCAHIAHQTRGNCTPMARPPYLELAEEDRSDRRLGERAPGPVDEALWAPAGRYYTGCDRFDRAVCTGAGPGRARARDVRAVQGDQRPCSPLLAAVPGRGPKPGGRPNTGPAKPSSAGTASRSSTTPGRASSPSARSTPTTTRP